MARRMKQAVAAALQDSVSLPEPWYFEYLWGFCNVYAAVGLCKASSPLGTANLPRQEATRCGGAVQGTWRPGAARPLEPQPPATIHGLYRASLQPDRANGHGRLCSSPKALLHGRNLMAWTWLKAKLLWVIHPLGV